MIRSSVLREVDVDNFLYRPAKVREVFDVRAIFSDSALTAKVTLENLHVRIERHTDLFDEGPLLVGPKDKLIALAELAEEYAETRSLLDLKANTKLILRVRQGSANIEHESLHLLIPGRRWRSLHQQTLDGWLRQKITNVLIEVPHIVGMDKHGFVHARCLVWFIHPHYTVEVIHEDAADEPHCIFEELPHHEHESAMGLKLSLRLEVLLRLLLMFSFLFLLS